MLTDGDACVLCMVETLVSLFLSQFWCCSGVGGWVGGGEQGWLWP